MLAAHDAQGEILPETAEKIRNDVRRAFFPKREAGRGRGESS
jgi:hypothetical protein